MTNDIDWTNERRKLSDLIPWEVNPRQLTEKQAEHLQASLTKFGLAQPFLISPENEIYDGHQRQALLNIMQEYGADADIDVRVSSRALTLDERRELVVRLHENTGDWNFDELANLYDVEELGEWGFPEWKIDEFMPDEEPEPEDAAPQINRAEELREQWGVESGQLWRLPSRTDGQEHRIVCGDCTDAAVVERVMGGEKIFLCATSPPYSDLRTYEVGEFDWDTLMCGFSDVVFGILENGASVAVNLGQKHTDGRVDFYWERWLRYCEGIGHPLFGLYIWAKSTGLPGNWNGRCMPSHEFIFHFTNGSIQANKWVKAKTNNPRKSGHNFRQKTGETIAAYSPDTIGQEYRIPFSVFSAPVQNPTTTADNEHPARFSEDFIGQIIKTWSSDGQNVYDPFGGSGTTMIACENLGRQCRMAEIAPSYCAIILQRYVDAFGIEPELIS